MRKYINGNRYDTATAAELGTWENGSTPYDLNWVRETLYRTKAGLYFVHGEGGANTRYSKTLGENSWACGERIVTLTQDSAREWAEQHLDADQVDRAFPAESPDQQQGISLTLPAEVLRKLDAAAAAANLNRSAYIRQLIIRDLGL